MKSKKSESRKGSATTTAAAPVRSPAKAGRSSPWPYLLVAAAVLVLVFWAYGPSLSGAFLFDDNVLPFALPGAAEPLAGWLHGVRPVLMFTYWVNMQVSGDQSTYSYHVLNVLFHCLTAALVFFIVRRLLEWSGVEASKRTLLAGFAASVFLLHPVQAEAVAYLAGRSEALSVMLAFAAFTVFLYRGKSAVTWGVVAAVLALFGLGILSKEHIVVLPVLLLLTDYWWNPAFSFRGIRSNWKLYSVMALGAFAGAFSFRGLILHASSAGFGLKDFTWYQYFFTQCRALFVYVGEFLLPVRLTADWDFPISHSLLEHGAIFGLLLLVVLGGAAWHYRRRFPLASYGFFVYLVLMSPTSSILPIRDPIAERRLYFSMLGLLLILVDVLARLHVERKALAAGCGLVALTCAVATHARAAVWADAVSLWTDTVAKSPDKARAHFQLGSAYYDAGRCDLAVKEFETTQRLQKEPTYNLLVDWALADRCNGHYDQALARMNQAAALEPTAHIYSQIGATYGQLGRWQEALDALAQAEKIDSQFKFTYFYRGLVFFKTGRLQDSAQEYRRALGIDPNFEQARQGLAQTEAALRAAH
jgi:tetratricopeptide (TPR) repeat protein